MKSALLYALLEPVQELADAEHSGNFTKRIALLERQKALPFGLVWERYCQTHGMPGLDWYNYLRLRG